MSANAAIGELARSSAENPTRFAMTCTVDALFAFRTRFAAFAAVIQIFGEVVALIGLAAGLTIGANLNGRAIATFACYTSPFTGNFVATTRTKTINAVPFASAVSPTFAAVVIVGLKVSAPMLVATRFAGLTNVRRHISAAVTILNTCIATDDPVGTTRAIAIDTCFAVVAAIAALTTILRVSLLV
jgi:hypothetical protein